MTRTMTRTVTRTVKRATKRQDIVVDATVLVAALDRSHERHSTVRHVLELILDQVDDQRSVLVTHTDAVTRATAILDERCVADASDLVCGLTAAFEVTPLHADFLRDARGVVDAAGDHNVVLPLDTALTIELARRRRTRRVLSLDPLLHLFEFERLLDGQSSPA